jgi:hypothetical protein
MHTYATYHFVSDWHNLLVSDWHNLLCCHHITSFQHRSSERDVRAEPLQYGCDSAVDRMRETPAQQTRR